MFTWPFARRLLDAPAWATVSRLTALAPTRLPAARASPVLWLAVALDPMLPVLVVVEAPLVPEALVSNALVAPDVVDASPLRAVAPPVRAAVLALSLLPAATAEEGPELAPLAPSMLPTVLAPLFPPCWPVPLDANVVLVAVPLFVVEEVLLTVVVALLLPPALAPPVVADRVPPSRLLVAATPMAVPLSTFVRLAVCWPLGFAFPVEALPVAVVAPLLAVVVDRMPPLVAFAAPLMPLAIPLLAAATPPAPSTPPEMAISLRVPLAPPLADTPICARVLVFSAVEPSIAPTPIAHGAFRVMPEPTLQFEPLSDVLGLALAVIVPVWVTPAAPLVPALLPPCDVALPLVPSARPLVAVAGPVVATVPALLLPPIADEVALPEFAPLAPSIVPAVAVSALSPP